MGRWVDGWVSQEENIIEFYCSNSTSMMLIALFLIGVQYWYNKGPLWGLLSVMEVTCAWYEREWIKSRQIKNSVDSYISILRYRRNFWAILGCYCNFSVIQVCKQILISENSSFYFLKEIDPSLLLTWSEEGLIFHNNTLICKKTLNFRYRFHTKGRWTN